MKEEVLENYGSLDKEVHHLISYDMKIILSDAESPEEHDEA